MPQSRDVYRHITNAFSKATVLKGMLQTWPSRQWSPEYLASVLKEKKLKIRTGPLSARNLRSVLWEVDCVHEEATLSQFCEWLSFDATLSPAEPSLNPLLKYNKEEHWCYVDYKQMAFLFEGYPEILEAVRWSDLGFVDRDGRQSTIWIGSGGAFTPGHYDTYGFNLVAQIYGRKRWHLFPPSQTHLLYPTRIPYEESSVFSPINIANPALERYPRFAEATPYIVTLEPGDVLFVPKHWWHFVESLEVSISINTWVEVESDKESRVQEALTRVLVSSLMSSSCSPRKWVNPTETICNDEMNYHYVQAALAECSHVSLDRQAATDDSSSHTWKKEARQTQDLPAHRPNTDLAVHPEGVVGKQALMQTCGSDGTLKTCETLETCSVFRPTSTSETDDTLESSSHADVDTDHGLKSEDKQDVIVNRDKTRVTPSTRRDPKRPLTDTAESSTQSKVPRIDLCQSDQEQSSDVLPDFIVPVKCQGQIYKQRQPFDGSLPSDVEPEAMNIMQMRSEGKADVSLDGIRQMVAECVTHPAVISLAARLLQEKCDCKS